MLVEGICFLWTRSRSVNRQCKCQMTGENKHQTRFEVNREHCQVKCAEVHSHVAEIDNNNDPESV